MSTKRIKKFTVKDFRLYEQGVKRLKKLERELDSLDTGKFRREENEIRKKLKNVSLIPEIEEDIRKLKLMIAGIDVGLLESKIDKRQDKKLLRIEEKEKLVEEKLSYNLPRIKIGLDILAAEGAKTGKRLPNISRKIIFLKDQLEKIERLTIKKELTADDKKNLSRIPSIKREIANLAREEEKTAGKLPYLRRLVRELQDRLIRAEETAYRKRRQLSSEQIKEIKKLPRIEKKTGFLSRLFKKESFDVENLGYKLDKNRLEFNEKLINEIAESRRMIQAGDEELKENLHALLVEIVKKMNQHKEQSDSKLMEKIVTLEKQFEAEKKREDFIEIRELPEISDKQRSLQNLFGREKLQIEELKNQLEAEKAGFNEEISSRLGETRKMLEDTKFEIKKQLLNSVEEAMKSIKQEREASEARLLKEIRAIEEKINLEKKDTSQNFTEKIVQLRDKITESKKDLEKSSLERIENLRKELAFSKEDGLNRQTSENHLPPLKTVLIKQKPVFGLSDLGIDFSNSPDFISSSAFRKNNPPQSAIYQKNALPSFLVSPEQFSASVKEEVSKKEAKKLPKINPEKFAAEKGARMPEKTRFKTSKISSKVFMTDDEFEIFYREFLEVKNAVLNMNHQVSRDIELRKAEQESLFAGADSGSEMRKKFAKLNSFFKFTE